MKGTPCECNSAPLCLAVPDSSKTMLRGPWPRTLWKSLLSCPFCLARATATLTGTDPIHLEALVTTVPTLPVTILASMSLTARDAPAAMRDPEHLDLLTTPLTCVSAESDMFLCLPTIPDMAVAEILVSPVTLSICGPPTLFVTGRLALFASYRGRARACRRCILYHSKVP